jgi:hypothetical protein
LPMGQSIWLLQKKKKKSWVHTWTN